jgi:DMSO reductase anchor subunit
VLDYFVGHYGLQAVVAVAVGLMVLYMVRVVYAMREGIRWLLRAIAASVLVFVLGMALLPELKVSKSDTAALSLLAALTALALTPTRSRSIPVAVKRQVIARDLKGKKYNPKKHHIDHIWPHARGGSSTADNLRVISKQANLRKGAKKPRLKDWL